MSHLHLWPDHVDIPAADPASLEVTGLHEVSYDPLGRTLRDAYLVCNIAQSCI